MRIKILHVIYTFDIGGLENGLVNLINYLPEKQFSHVVCVLSKGKKCIERVHNNIKYYELNKKDGNDFSIPVKIASIIRKESIDIVHTRNWVCLVEGVLGGLLGGCRSLVHGEHGKEIDDTVRQPLRRNVAKRICFRFVKKLITVSESLDCEIRTLCLCDVSKIKCIMNGVDTQKFNFNSKKEKVNYRKKYCIPENAFVIGSVGRLAKVKNYELMVSVCNDLKSDNSYFVIAGDGPERAALEEAINNKGLYNKFNLLGEQADINEVLSTFDVFMNTSRYEGISNTILEAMSKGIPVIANSVGGTPEILQGGITGYLISRNSEDAYVEAIQKLMQDKELRSKMSYASRLHVEQNLSLEHMVRGYDNIYMSVG